MGIIITIVGLLLGISIYFILINLFEESKDKIKKIRSKENNAVKTPPNKNGNIDKKSNEREKKTNLNDFPKTRALSDELKNQLPGRKCPLCSHILTRDEPLYATTINTDGVKKILIYGCQYCHKKREPEFIKKENSNSQ